MQILIKRLDGDKKTVDVEPTTTITELKLNFGQKMGIDPKQLRLVFKGAPLLDDKTVAESNIAAGDIIHIILQLNG